MTTIYYAISSGGDVVRWGQAQDEAQARLQALVGEVVHISVQVIPPRPSPAHIFDVDTWTWADPRTKEQQTADAWQQVRTQRDRLLIACDWTQLPDVPQSVQQAWLDYRQALRDITLQPDPTNTQWPEVPTAPTSSNKNPNEYPSM